MRVAEHHVLRLHFSLVSSTQDNHGQIPLHIAAMEGSVASTTLLLKHGSPVNLPDADGQTPLHVAIQAGRLDTAEALLAAGANRNAKNKDNETPMHIAAKGMTTSKLLVRVYFLFLIS